MIELETHHMVDAGKIAAYVPYSWWTNFLNNAKLDTDVSVTQWGAQLSWHGGSSYNFVLEFEKDEDATAFILKWS